MVVLVRWCIQNIIIVNMYCIFLYSFCILGSFSISAISSAAGNMHARNLEFRVGGSSTYSITNLKH
uniref:Putative ovule protein n=1 Tax=Solanum chacoense TaxID=4108 RepID=A0A0V0HRR5_SOLCH